jgi:molybdate transport system permease protein
MTPRREGAPAAAVVVASIGAALFVLRPALLEGTVGRSVHLVEPEALAAMRLSSCARWPRPRRRSCWARRSPGVQARGAFAIAASARRDAAPVVLPPVVGGVTLLAVFGRHGSSTSGSSRSASACCSAAGAVLAETFVAMPFFVLAMEGALRSRSPGSTRRAPRRRWTVFRRVTLRSCRRSWPAPRSAGRARGEPGATITFAELPDRT